MAKFIEHNKYTLELTHEEVELLNEVFYDFFAAGTGVTKVKAFARDVVDSIERVLDV